MQHAGWVLVRRRVGRWGSMAILFRRLIISLLIPYLWRRWRGRSNREDGRMEALEPSATPAGTRPVPGARDVTDGLVVGEEY
jgi:hypothetical protein